MALAHLVLAAIALVFVSLTINGASAYGTAAYAPANPKAETPKPEERKTDVQKPTINNPKVDHDSNHTKQSTDKIKTEKPKVEVKELYKTIGVQGVVYCKVGSKLIPLQGATTRVTCTTIDKHGFESDPFSVLSKTTDKKGYFIAKLPISELESQSKLFKCKAFLNSSPMRTCNVPTDVNKGSTGALPYSSFQLLTEKKMKLYSVGPFIYSSKKV